MSGSKQHSGAVHELDLGFLLTFLPPFYPRFACSDIQLHLSITNAIKAMPNIIANKKVVIIVVVVVLLVLGLALGLGLGLGLKKHHKKVQLPRAGLECSLSVQCQSPVIVSYASPEVVLQTYATPSTLYNVYLRMWFDKFAVTVFVSGLSLAPQSIVIKNTDNGDKFELPYNGTDIYQLVVTVPATATPGKYDVLVTGTSKCAGLLSQGLTVVSPTDSASIFAITSINPSFLYNGTSCVSCLLRCLLFFTS